MRSETHLIDKNDRKKRYKIQPKIEHILNLFDQ